MTKERAKGFYWVKVYGEWIIAEYQGDELGYWYVCGDEYGLDEGRFDEINEMPLNEPGKIPERTSITSILFQSGQNKTT